MKKIVFILSCAVMMFGAADNSDDKLLETHLKKQIEREKKYAKEQKFYTDKNYDYKGVEVDPKIVDKVPVIEVDDMDMDDVYSD